MKHDERTLRIALLIDAENASSLTIREILSLLSSLGSVAVRRAYGDWTTAWLGRWKEVLNELAIQPVQQFSFASGKNATDASLIIDAMDLLHTQSFDAFCIVSSDSDFTRLATRIRESGSLVFGFGERKTPKSFVAACDRFELTEQFRRDELNSPASIRAKVVGTKIPKHDKKALRNDKRLMTSLRNAIHAASMKGGWADLSLVASHLAKLMPEFDPRNYGYKNLSKLLKRTELYKMESRKSIKGHQYFVLRSKLENHERVVDCPEDDGREEVA